MIVSIEEAVELLKNEKIVAIPTETVYGLAGIATSEKAVQKIYQAKNRPADNPLICHFYSIEQIKEYIPNLSQNALKVLKHFSPGPVSVLVQMPDNSPLKPATRGQNSVICRIPNHPQALEIIKKVSIPIAAPSANTSGKTSGTNAKMVEKDLGTKIDGVVDGGSSHVGLESAIVDCRNENYVTILRPGAIGEDELTNLGIEVRETETKTGDVTPGAKYPHYSPDCHVFRLNSIEEIPNGSKEKIAVLLTKEDFEKARPVENIEFINIGSLQNIEEIAKNLYRNLIKIDSLKVQKAYFINHDWGNSSIAKAIKNRLDKVFKN